MADNNDKSAILAKKIAEGTASREERGITLKTLNTQLAIDLVGGLEDVKVYVESLKELKSKMREKFIKRVEEALELDEMDTDTMFKYMNGLFNNEIALTESYRKLLQGGQLFSEDSLSEEDRIILRILRSFSTTDEKKDFFQLVAKYMAQKNISLEDANIIVE